MLAKGPSGAHTVTPIAPPVPYPRLSGGARFRLNRQWLCCPPTATARTGSDDKKRENVTVIRICMLAPKLVA